MSRSSSRLAKSSGRPTLSSKDEQGTRRNYLSSNSNNLQTIDDSKLVDNNLLGQKRHKLANQKPKETNSKMK